MKRYSIVFLFHFFVLILIFSFTGINSEEAELISTYHSKIFLEQKLHINKSLEVIDTDHRLFLGRKVTLGENQGQPLLTYWISRTGKVKKIDIIEENFNFIKDIKYDVYEVYK